MITRRTFRPRIVVFFLLTQCALTIGHLRGEKNSEEESFDDDLALDGGSAYDDEWHAGDFAESGGDQDMISQYSKYGADALPSEATWTDRVIPLIEMERIRQEELLASESEEEGAEYYKSEKSNVQRPSIPYNYSVVNTSGYLNRSWADIQKHYGPKLGWWDKTRLRLKRMLEFSRNGASNCINTGGGQVPLYEYCEGCDMLEAQYCLWDMRYNVSGNVRFGCEMDHITDGAQPKCCAQWGNMNDFWTVMGTTSALGDAMLCLQNVGCEKTEYYTTLEEECVFNTCNTLYVNEIASGTQFLAGKEPRLSVLFKNAASAVSGVPFSHHDYTKTYSDVESSTKVIVEQERNGELYTPVYYKNGCLDEANEGNSEVKGKYWKKESGINWDTNWKWNRKSRVYEGAGGAHPTVTTDRGVQNVNLIKYRAITEDWGGKNWHQLLDDSAGDDSQNSCSSYGCQIQGRKVSNTARAELKLRNWADDEVREARQYHDWRKLFLGWDAKRDDKAQTLDDDKYDDDIMIGRASSKYWKNRGTFDQIKDIDRDTRITKMPARCKGCQPSNRNPRSDYVPPCFSGHSLVELESGNTKAMSQLEVGDRILSADASGQLSFDDVIFLPHGRNSIVADFVSVTAESGKQVHATPIHLFRMCDGGLSMASDLRAGSCIRTVDGDEILSLIEKIADSDAGVYTAVVARNEFIVVDGFVASPFATAPIGHWAVHRLYHIHRLLYWLMPTVMKNLPTTVVATNSILGAGLSLALDTVLKSSSSTTGSL